MTLPASYFDGIYATGDDPWGFRSRWYERRKYAATLAALPKERYRRGFEPGCSIGELSALLATRCDALLCADVAEAAVVATRQRLGAAGSDAGAGERSTVEVRRLAVPHEWPAGRFDLIVLSELGYYLSCDDLAMLLSRAVASLEPDGALVVVHWRHPVADYPLTGDDVHAVLRAMPDVQPVVRHEEKDFLLDVVAPAPARSVAELTGLVAP